MSDARTPAVIKYKDFTTLDEEDEFLKRYYKFSEYDYKIGLLVEYYKYHKKRGATYRTASTRGPGAVNPREVARAALSLNSLTASTSTATFSGSADW